jgi:hypothetical protein
MTKRVAVTLSLVILGLSSGILRAEETQANISGKWETGSGAVYLFSQINENISAVYDAPNQEQLATGIKQGDVAFSGTVVGNIVSGIFYQRLSTEKVPACSASFYEPTHLYLTVSDDATTIEGDLLRTHVDDSCRADKRFFQHLTFKRKG